MLIGFDRPDAIWTVSGTGASITAAIDNIDDGRPDTLTRLQWISGTQNTSSVFKLRADWTDGIVPRIAGLSNISLPVGTKVQVRFRRASDTAGTYPYEPTQALAAYQRVFEGPRGERTAWILYDDGATAVVGCEIQIYNDVNGAATIVASALFDVGEAVVAGGADVKLALGPSRTPIDPSTQSFSWESTPYTTPGLPYRQLSVKFAIDQESAFVGGGMDIETLLGRIDRGQRAVYVQSYTDAAGNYSAQLAHRYALIGIATRLPVISHEPNSVRLYSTGDLTIVESPIPV